MEPESKLIDVANAAKVSLTTASFVLNGRGSISNVIRKRVTEAAAQLKYKRRRKPKASIRTETYALVIDMSAQWAHAWTFYEPILEGLSHGFESGDFNPIIVPFNPNASKQDLLIQLRLMDCRMVFIIECEDAEAIEFLEKNNIKTVVLNDSQHQDRFHTICQDDIQGAYESTRYLIDRGHRNIWITDWSRAHTPYVTNDRFIGYKKALDEAKVKFKSPWHISLQSGEPSELQGLVRKIKTSKSKPTALYIHGDFLARKLQLYLAHDQIRIPEDISIIAHGDLLIYHPEDPFAITTMKLDTYEMGMLAAQSMLNRIRSRSDDKPLSLKLRSSIVERGSIKTIA